MVKVAVVYHSGFGHTEVVAKSIIEGVKRTEAKDILINIENLEDINSLEEYQGLIFGAPTYMGSLSSSFKKFMEDTSKIWYQRKWQGKIAAGFTNSGSLEGGKANSLLQLAIFAAQHGMIWVNNKEVDNSPDGEKGKIDSINRTGAYLGLAVQSDNQDPSITPKEGDKDTAVLFGEYVSKITLQMCK